MKYTETSFPRGGRKPAAKIKKTLFGKTKKRHAKKNSNRKKDGIEKFDMSKSLTATSSEPLTYKSIQEGMIILGAVREIQQMHLNISLPGRLSARCPVTNISKPYTELLQLLVQNNKQPDEYCTLKQLFKCGQHVICKVVEIKRSKDDCFEVTVTLSTDQIYSELRHDNLSENMVITAAVSSIEDHGYVMDVGVKNSRAFLSKLHVDRKLEIGQLVWCKIDKVSTTSVASTITLNAIDENVFKSKLDNGKTLNEVFPGMKVQFTIDKILRNGIQGTFLNDFTGYINESHLKTPLESINNYHIGQKVDVRFLYIMPTTKFAYFTIQDIKYEDMPILQQGKIAQGKVLKRIGKGVFLKMPQEYVGYVSYNRLKAKDNNAESLEKKYPVGSKHNCRIIGYEYMDRVYICTMEKDALKEKIFTADDLKLGEQVSAIVDKILPNGISVFVGKLSAFVQNLHLSDIPLKNMTPVLKKKFSTGQKINARVLQIHPESKHVFLTLKQSLLDTKLPCISSFDNIKKGTQYDGYIVKITEKGLLVAFYGDVKGWVPKSHLSIEPIQNIEKVFSVGQVVKCTVLNIEIDSKKLLLSLLDKNVKNTVDIKKGEQAIGTVEKVTATGLEISLNKGGFVFLPMLHLTDHPTLAKSLLDIYAVGDTIENLVCVDTGHGVPIVSLRETKHLKDGILNWKSINKDTVLRCSVLSVSDKIMLQSPINNFNRFITVGLHDVSDFPIKDVKYFKLQKYQPIICKVISVDHKKKSISATMKLSICYKKRSLKEEVDILASYMEDIFKIRHNWSLKDKSLAKLCLGENVRGEVVSIATNGSCIIKLNSGVDAVVPKEHFNKNLEKSEKVNGTIMWLDYPENTAIVTLLPKFISSINPKQDSAKLAGKEGISLRATVLLIRPDFVVAVLKAGGKCQLIFLPVKTHVNDILPRVDEYDVGKTIKIFVYKHFENYSIGLLKELVKCDKEMQKGLSNNNNVSAEMDIEEHKPNTKPLKTTKRRQKESISEENDNKSVSKKKIKLKENKRTDELEQNKKSKLSEIKNTSSDSDPKSKVSTKKKKKLKPNDTDVTNIKIDELIKNNEAPISSKKVKKSDKNDETDKIPLSGADNFWNLPSAPLQNVEKDISSDSDEDKSVKETKKKKKLTAAERTQAAHKQEERIREIEERLADTNATPESAEQFDRLVISQPNNSLIWINYMAFHLQSTEIEKARAVAKKALDTISFREEQEKLNVWLALLNLENRFGSKESFTSVLEEAAKLNDSLTVYTRAMMMLANTGKQSEMQETLNVIIRRFKHEPEAWLQTATACFTSGLLEKARHLLQKALCSLDKKQHVDFIVQFALLESKHGETERAETLFEQVLTSYPRRVDVWTVYIDMLIKSKKNDIARKVLERSIYQKLPARKMKTLFKKFIDFEQMHGDHEKLEKIKQLAAEYVRNATE